MVHFVVIQILSSQNLHLDPGAAAGLLRSYDREQTL